MAHLKSAMKKAEKSLENNERNKATKSKMRSTIKRTLASLTAENVRLSSSVIDKAASKGVIHKNARNRYKSRIAKKALAAGSK